MVRCIPRHGFWLVVVCSLLCGCTSRPVDEGRTDMPVRVTASADPSRHDLRPVPEVITKPKPFRLPDVIGEVPSLEPVTMASRNGFVLPGTAHETAAQAPLEFPQSRPAVEEVAAMLRDYLAAFNRHDAAALAAHWTATGENVDLDTGETTRGREAVEDVFATLFQADDGAAIDIDIESIRPLRDDVAVVDGVTHVAFSDAGDGHGRPAGSRFSAVVVKERGRWMLESVREASLVKPLGPGPAATRPIDALGWLVGAWEDAGEGVTAGTQCSWSAGRAFLVRSHVVTFDSADAVRPVSGDDSIPGLLPPGAGPRREISEIIGWDPDRQQIRSWLFTSEGRFAEATWTPEGNAWRVLFDGRGADAGASGSLLLERLGPDEIAIRCDADGLADVMPPACDFMRTARLGDEMDRD
ncbi:MAG: SgcJ/EcaC family oxidoreductase [Planctomycetia bacterium]